MKSVKALSFVLWIVAGAASDVPAAESGPKPPESDRDKMSYSMGMDVGRNFKYLGINADLDQMVQGLKDGMTGAQPRVSEREMREMMAVFRAGLLAHENQLRTQALADNKKKGEDFSQQYAQREGAKELSDGILYRVLKQGSGARPQANDLVQCNYRGQLIDGAEFDASEPGHPAVFDLAASGVIPGWKKALVAMPIGSKWEVVVPPAQAYGDKGVGRDIPPAATLVFEIELLDAKQAQAVKADDKRAEAPTPKTEGKK